MARKNNIGGTNLRSSISCYLVLIMLAALMFSRVISLLIGTSIHYHLLVFFTVWLAALQYKRIARNAYWSVAALTLLIGGVQVYQNENLCGPVAIAFVYYVVLPLVYSSVVIEGKRCNKAIKGLLRTVAVSYFIGLVFQKFGLLLEYFPIERVIVDDVIVGRYTSIAGGCLPLGYTAAIIGIQLSFWILVDKSKFWNIICCCMAVYCVLASMSRGALIMLVAGIVVVSICYEFSPPRLLKRSKLLILRRWILYSIGLGVVFTLLLCFLFYSDNPIIGRIRDIVDFNEEGNLVRVESWIKGLQLGASRPYLGNGLGTTGSVTAVISDNSYQDLATESYFIKIYVEGGAIMAIVYILFILFVLFRALIRRRYWRSDMPLAIGVMSALTVGCSYLQVLESPLYSVVYWLVVGALQWQGGVTSPGTSNSVSNCEGDSCRSN